MSQSELAPGTVSSPELVQQLRLQLAQVQREVENLQVALRSARRIGMAIGVLMATLRATEDAAFQALTRASQNLNVKVRDLAETVVLTGKLPEP